MNYLNRSEKMSCSIKEKYAGYKRPKPIPMLPTELTTLEFYSLFRRDSASRSMPIGLHEELVQPVYIDIGKINIVWYSVKHKKERRMF